MFPPQRKCILALW